MAAPVRISTGLIITAVALAFSMGCGSSSDGGGDKDKGEAKAEGGAKPSGEADAAKTPEAIAAAYPVGSTKGCDAAALEAATKAWTDVPPEGLAKAAGAAITSACGEALSEEQNKFLRLIDRDMRPFSDELATQMDAVAAEACPSLAKLRADNAKAAPLDGAKAIFDGCGFAKYGVLAQEDVTAFYGADPRAQSFFPWLAERGVAGPVAASVVRGLLNFEAYTAGAAALGNNGALSTVGKAEAIPACPIVRVGTRTVDLGSEMLVMVGPDKAIDPSALRGHLIAALYQKLEPFKPAEGDETPLCIAAAQSLPFSTMVDVMYTAGRSGFRHLAWVVATEERPHSFGAVRADLPVFGLRGQKAPFGPGLAMSAEAFAMELASGESETVGTGLDYEALAKKLGRMKLEVPDATIVTIQVENDVPVSAVMKAIAVGTEAGFRPILKTSGM